MSTEESRESEIAKYISAVVIIGIIVYGLGNLVLRGLDIIALKKLE